MEAGAGFTESRDKHAARVVARPITPRRVGRTKNGNQQQLFKQGNRALLGICSAGVLEQDSGDGSGC